VALLALAGLLRVSAMYYEGISGDDATVALIAKHFLSGENWPVFFYRQTFMGSLNGIHMVPALYVFGPSVLLVRLNAIAWSLLFPLGLYVLARRLYDEAAARLTLLLAAVPPFLLTYYSTVAEPHFETNTFGVVLLLLALGARTAAPEPARTRALGCLGLVGGLALWTSPKVVMVLGPIVLLLLLWDPRLPARRGALLGGAGLLVGGLPAWLYYLTQQDPGQGNLGSARRFLDVGVDLSWSRLSRFAIEVPPLVVGTYYFDPKTGLRVAALSVALAIYLAAIAGMCVKAFRARREAPPGRGWGVTLLALTLVATFAALYFSEFSQVGAHARGRYVLPAYIPLLVFLGAAIAALARRSRGAAGLVLAFVLAFNLWTNLAFLWPLRPEDRARRAAVIERREAFLRHLDAHPVEAVLIDNPYESLVLQFLRDRPVVSAMATEIYYPAALRTDASARVSILAERDARGVEAKLRTLDASAAVREFGTWRFFEDVRVPARSFRLLPRTAWRVIGEPAGPPSVADGDLGTAWPARRLAESEAAPLVVDLGAPHAVARLVLWPTALTDVLVPLEIAGSADGVAWGRLGVTPAHVAEPAFAVGARPLFRPRNGWLELVLSPRPVRYLSVRPVEAASVGAGMVGELFVYEAADGLPAEGPGLETLLPRLRARGVRRLLADPVVSARIALATNGQVRTIPANGVLNNHGLAPPTLLYARLRLRATDAALVPAEDADELRERLRTSGVQVTPEALGAYVLFQPAGPLPTSARCRAASWRVTRETPEADGRSSRYVVEGRLEARMRVAAIRLQHPLVSSHDTALLALEVSEDEGTWRPVSDVRSVPEWAWAGRTLFTFASGASEIALAGVPARAVRLEVRLPFRGEGAITSLCVRAEPAR
jgi:4-amino-4-deoxy-L-arabinose transferase-like glycosyltransferase